MLTANTTRPPIAKTSLHALAAAMAPKSEGSSTSGGKKSVVLTSASSGVSWYTAASSKGARPTNKEVSKPMGMSLTMPANKEAPHFAAQPPHEVHSVSLMDALLGMVRKLLG